jgi:hypothetical protein
MPQRDSSLLPFLGIVFAWQRHRGRRLGIADGQTGAVTFLQRSGGALNLNPHTHCILPDGLFFPAPTPALDPSGPAPLAFAPLPPPTDEEVALLARRIARRLTVLARRTLGEDGEELADEDEDPAVLRQDLASALTPRLAADRQPCCPRSASFHPRARRHAARCA